MVREDKHSLTRLKTESTGPSYDGNVKLATLCSMPRQTVRMIPISRDRDTPRVRGECTCTLNHISKSTIKPRIENEKSSSTKFSNNNKHEENSSVAHSDIGHNTDTAGTNIYSQNIILSDMLKAQWHPVNSI